MRTFTWFPSTTSDSTVARTAFSLILNRAERGTVTSLMPSTNPPPEITNIDPRLHVTRQLIHGFTVMQRPGNFAGIEHQGIFHHDVKAENILLDSNNNIHIIDFGTSCFLEPNMTIPRSLDINQLGTTLYTPPELRNRSRSSPFSEDPTHAQNNYEKYKKFDSWANGVIIAQIALGRNGLPNDSTMDQFQNYVMTATQNIPPDPANRTTHQHVLFVIRNLMEENPQNRWTMEQANTYMNQHLPATPPPTSQTTLSPTSQATPPPTSQTTSPPISQTTPQATSQTTLSPTSQATLPPVSQTTLSPTSQATLQAISQTTSQATLPPPS